MASNLLDLAWFETGKGTIPHACSGTYQIVATAADACVLATHYDFHGYLEKPTMISQFGGAPLLEVRHGKGTFLASEMTLDARATDPVAGRLLRNLLDYLGQPSESAGR